MLSGDEGARPADTGAGALKTKPTVQRITGKRPEMLAQFVEIINGLDGSKAIFRRGGICIRISIEATDANFTSESRTVRVPKEQASIVPVNTAYAMNLMEESAEIVVEKKDPKTKEKALFAANAKREEAELLIAGGDFRRLFFVARFPLIRADGTIVDRPGYDNEMAIFYHPSCDFLSIPNTPGQEDAKRALDILLRPFRKFPFCSEADRMVVAAEILTLLARHLVNRVPMFFHTATEPGSGKTKIAETVSLIVFGAGIHNQTAAVLTDEQETRKAITSLIMMGAPAVVFDNAKRGSRINSDPLNQFVTMTVYTDRVLGGNQMLSVRPMIVAFITGNDTEPTGDSIRRSLTLHLNPQTERPEQREFGFDPEAEAKRDRAELMQAAYTILRAHALAGHPGVGGRAAIGSFEEWDRLVCGAIVYAGGADPAGVNRAVREDDQERQEMAAVFEALKRAFGIGVKFKAGAVCSRASADEALREAILPAARDPARGVLDALRFGHWLRSNRDRMVNGLRLRDMVDSHAKGKTYWIEQP